MENLAPPKPIPKTPRRRRRWIVVGGFVALLLVTPFFYLAVAGWWSDRELEQLYREMDTEDPHWRWADLVAQQPPQPPAERNAMVHLQKLIAIQRKTPFRSPFGGKMPAPKNARLTDADEQRLRAALAALAPTFLDEAHKLKDMPEGCAAIKPAARPWDQEFGALEIMHLATVLEHDAMLHVQNGKMIQAVDASLAMANSAHAIGDFPHLRAQLVRSAVQDKAVDAIDRTLGNGIVDDEQLEALLAALAIEAKHDGSLHAFRGERAYGHAYYVALRDGDITAGNLIRDMGLDRTPQGKLYYFFPNMILRGYPEYLRLQNEIVRASKLKDNAQIEALAKIEETTHEPAGPWVGIFLLGQIKQVRADHTRLRCAVAAIAAERYRLKHDRWPSSIAELLKEGSLKEPITDPNDGQPLRFHRTPTGLLVVSVGADKVDDRGTKDDISFELWLPAFRAIAPHAPIEAAPKK